jgi:hypothetical protein
MKSIMTQVGETMKPLIVKKANKDFSNVNLNAIKGLRHFKQNTAPTDAVAGESWYDPEDGVVSMAVTIDNDIVWMEV